MPDISPSNQPSNALTFDMVTNSMPMTNNPNQIPSEAQVYLGDQAVLAVANSKTAIRYCDNGVFKNGTPNTGDIIIFTDSVTTLGGSATFYPTSNRLSTGTALCSYLSADSIQPNYRDSSGIYLPGAVTIGAGTKSISQAFAKQTFTGITILTNINVLGSTTNTTIPDGVTVKATWWGVSV